MEMWKEDELSRKTNGMSKSLKPDSQRIWETASRKVPAPSLFKQDNDADGEPDPPEPGVRNY